MKGRPKQRASAPKYLPPEPSRQTKPRRCKDFCAVHKTMCDLYEGHDGEHVCSYGHYFTVNYRGLDEDIPF